MSIGNAALSAFLMSSFRGNLDRLARSSITSSNGAGMLTTTFGPIVSLFQRGPSHVLPGHPLCLLMASMSACGMRHSLRPLPSPLASWKAPGRRFWAIMRRIVFTETCNASAASLVVSMRGGGTRSVRIAFVVEADHVVGLEVAGLVVHGGAGVELRPRSHVVEVEDCAVVPLGVSEG